MTLRAAILDYIQKELGFTGSLFLVPFPGGQDEGLTIIDKGQWESDPIRIRQYPTIQLFLRSKSAEACRDWCDTLYRAFNTGRPLQLTSSFRIGRTRAAGPPFPLGPDALGLHRRTLDLQISLRYDAEI